jgi:hypothetical protein
MQVNKPLYLPEKSGNPRNIVGENVPKTGDKDLSANSELPTSNQRLWPTRNQRSATPLSIAAIETRVWPWLRLYELWDAHI